MKTKFDVFVWYCEMSDVWNNTHIRPSCDGHFTYVPHKPLSDAEIAKVESLFEDWSDGFGTWELREFGHMPTDQTYVKVKSLRL